MSSSVRNIGKEGKKKKRPLWFFHVKIILRYVQLLKKDNRNSGTILLRFSVSLKAARLY